LEWLLKTQIMRTSILIAAHNEGDGLWKTIRACAETTSGLPYELIVVDDASDDGSVEEAKRRFPQIRVVHHDVRLGTSPTKHRAALEAEGDVLVFLDAHTNPEFGTIKRLVEDVEILQGNAIITPAVPNLDTGRWLNSRSQIGHGYSMRLDVMSCQWIPLKSLKVHPVGRRQFYESPALIGCALAIGKGLYQELWGFDADMRIWGVEDIDFGLKSWLLGYPILHDPQAIVGHRFRKTADNYEVPNEHVVVNQLRMARKHFSSAVWSHWVEACRQRNNGVLVGHPEGMWARVWQLFEEKRASVEQERQYLHSRRVNDEFWYAERFGLEWPRLESKSGSTSSSVKESGTSKGLSLSTDALIPTVFTPISGSPSPSSPVPPVEPPCENPKPVCSCSCQCGCSSGRLPKTNVAPPMQPGVTTSKLIDSQSNCSSSSSMKPIRYFNGQIRLSATDIESDGFGVSWEHSRVYCNLLSENADVGQGYNWLVPRWAYLVQQSDDSIVVVRGTQGSLWFDPSDGG
jgi:GT2 family glycosyltransferase